MSEDIKKVYLGSRVEAMFIKEMLEESEIGVSIKDHLASSVQAGWADGASDSVTLYVEAFNEEKAKNLIAEYIAERESPEGINYNDKG
jgi:hypothetical protein